MWIFTRHSVEIKSSVRQSTPVRHSTKLLSSERAIAEIYDDVIFKSAADIAA